MSSFMKRQNILQLMRDRELNDHIRYKYALKDTISNKCISRLGMLAELEGHRGCVNCLQWNERGSMLASASDDFQVILWDPFLQKIRTKITTLHRGNIFTVKFIPGHNDDVVATGAGDWTTHTYDVTTGKQLSVCNCPIGRVKRIAVANDTPNVYWSASEDGIVRQHDLRLGHDCTSSTTNIILVTTNNTKGDRIEAKCLDINQLRTEQIAVGASDPYVRLYDRRMIRSLSSFTMKSPENNTCNPEPEKIAQYFIPGHIHSEEISNVSNKNIGVTYLTFSPDGQELLVNYGGEYVYLYDILNQVESAFCNIPKVMKLPQNGEGSSTDIDPVPVPHVTLPDEVEKLKFQANYLFENKDYTAAINLYNKAIHIFECSVLFSNRAAAYIKRKWHGDFYAALIDCVTALKLDPNHMKAHFRLALCLYELKKYKDSKMYLDQFTMKYPSYKTSVAFKILHDDLLLVEQKIEKKTRDVCEDNSNSTGDGDKDIGQLGEKRYQNMSAELYFRKHVKDYHHRYYGHCNTSTDIKEANFFGSQSQFIVAGSDDGFFFVWDRNTENNLLILKGDTSIVNCLQPHPSEFMLATSGIDNEVKLWTPLSDDVDNTFAVKHYKTTALLNQRRMIADPFEIIMHNMRRSVEQDIDMERRPDEGEIPEQIYMCRPS
ncbi:Hypothetical protein CINCED_3A009379 [Cinara cedri]|uniref:WD and tetratricopeptide repeats protein 1 n=1 Tax=Cinara cedri TaxID=506608 RepID=A0A5E4MN14_9HEMI|nr:Hypothetical protein CINCED_3A009379 [Cinara cedri]